MSDSLKDIVSIGQLTGDLSVIKISIDKDQIKQFDLFSFVIDDSSCRCMVFATRQDVLDMIGKKGLAVDVIFEGKTIASGTIHSLGYEPIKIETSFEDMMMVHLKRNN
jgi:hypothetical protein